MALGKLGGEKLHVTRMGGLADSATNTITAKVEGVGVMMMAMVMVAVVVAIRVGQHTHTPSLSLSLTHTHQELASQFDKLLQQQITNHKFAQKVMALTLNPKP